MFGYVQVNTEQLSEEEKLRYRAVYCGLCHSLGERHGLWLRLGLNYDLTFVALLLNSLYEPDEDRGESRCVVHPVKKQSFSRSKYTDYAADMTVALTYFKCLDDWNDDKALPQKCYASMLKKAYARVKDTYPEHCEIIERELNNIAKIENSFESSPDAGASSFGRLMSAVLTPERDAWEPILSKLGYELGRFIYLADAAVDLPQDKKKERYNPLAATEMDENGIRLVLKNILGEASQAFEFLPLVQDVNILKNILYSGVWIKFNQGKNKERKKTENGH